MGALPPERLARWLLCPVASVAAHWCLLVSPEGLLAFLPRLRRVAADPSAPGGVEAERDLTPEDFLNDFLLELDSRRTTYDRVASVVFVALLWAGVLGLMVPPILFCCGPCTAHAAALWRQTLLPFGRALHRLGVFEACGYCLALIVSAEGCRSHVGPSNMGTAFSLSGGLAFLPLWAYSTWLHADSGSERAGLLLRGAALGGLLQASVLAPLALVHGSVFLGLPAVAALYGSIGCAASLSGGRLASAGFDPSSGAHCCAAASLLLLSGAVCLRALGFLPQLAPFAAGLAVFGHIGYLAAVLALASKWRSVWETYLTRQAFALLSLAIFCLWGWLRSAPALTCASYAFALLFVLEKELESKFDNLGIKVLSAYLVLQYMYSSREYLATVLEPENLYS